MTGSSRNRFGLVGGTALASLMASTAASAQTAPQAAAPPGTQLSEVVVTAQKRDERVRDVPASVSVIGGEQLETFHAVQLADYAAYVPGFNVVQNGAPGLNKLTLRGIDSGSNFNSTVGVYIDDSPVSSSSSFGGGGLIALDLFPYDVQRVEVLKGPQGTLYGANTLGGLLKYVTVAPNLDKSEFRAGGDVSGTEGSGDTGGGGRVQVNLPIVPGKLAIRAGYFYERLSGYVDDIKTGVKDENGGERQGARVSLLWKPSEDVSVKLGALYQRTHTNGFSFVDIDTKTGASTYGDLQRSHLLPEGSVLPVGFYSATVNWNLHWATLTSASSYSHSTASYGADYSSIYGPILGLPVGYRGQFPLEKSTQEFRLASPSGGAFEYLVGAFYTYERTRQSEALTTFTPTGAVFAAFNPLAVVGSPGFYNEYAIFGDATYRFNERFDLTAGVRYAENRQKFRQTEQGILFNRANPFAVISLPGGGSDDVTTYSVSPRFHLTPDTLVYGRIASGYRPGGPNVGFPGIPAAFGPDQLTNYEAGVKAEFLNHRASIDFAAFYIDWTDIQVSLIQTGLNYLANAGSATSKGFEVTGALSPIAGLRLGANASYTDATLDDAAPSLGAKAGDRTPNAPRWTAAITASYSFPVWKSWTGEVDAGLRYVGDRYSAFPSSATAVRFDSYQILDLSAAITDGRYQVRFYAKNLADERAYLNLATNSVSVNQPRTIGLSVDVRY